MYLRWPSERTHRENRAALLFALFVVSINFLPGGLANAIGIACFFAAWGLIFLSVRQGPRINLRIDGITVALLGAFAIRVVLPPYGIATNGFSGGGLTHVLLIVGLYGLILTSYTQVRFDDLLLILAASAGLSALFSLGWYLIDHPDRLAFVGRSASPIIGVGGIVPGLAAALALLSHRDLAPRGLRAGLILSILVEVVVVFLSGSRGPIIALVFAVVCAPSLVRRSSWRLLFVGALAAWSVVTLTILLEDPIKQALCPITSLACRASMRHDVWLASVRSIIEHPLLGVGFKFRFPVDLVLHPHNGLLGLAFFYGIPLLVLFLTFLAQSARDISRLENPHEKYLTTFLLLFAMGFMGADLADPIRFFNTHYLFLWMPLFVAKVGQKRDVVGLPKAQASR